MYLWSRGPGTGKTSAALALLDHVGRPSREWNCSRELRDFAAGFIDFSDTTRLFRAASKKSFFWHRGGSGGNLTDGDLWEWIRRDNLIVIDDVRKPSEREAGLGEDHYGILKRILDLRVNRPLVLTSNLDPYEPQGGGVSELVKVFDDRIADRIHAGTIFELAGESRRVRRPQPQ